MKSLRPFIFSGGRPVHAASNTNRSVSPGSASMVASAAASPPKLAPTIETVFAPVLVEIAYRGQHVVLCAIFAGLGLELAAPAEVDGQHTKSSIQERRHLFLPTFLVETPSMRKHDGALAFSVQIGVDDASILSWKRDMLLHHGNTGQKASGRNNLKNDIRELYCRYGWISWITLGRPGRLLEWPEESNQKRSRGGYVAPPQPKSEKSLNPTAGQAGAQHTAPQTGIFHFIP
jgi:hypothetical protein